MLPARAARLALATFAALALAAAALPIAALLAPALFKAPLERWVSAHSGRELRIGGALSFGFGRALVIRAGEVTWANAHWGRAGPMFSARESELAIDLALLLRGRLTFRHVRLVQPELLIERDAGGRRNWVLDQRDATDARVPDIGHLVVGEGSIRVIDVPDGVDLTLALATETADAVLPLRIDVAGRYRDRPVAGRIRGGDPLAALTAGADYPIALALKVGDTAVGYDGRIAGLGDWTRFAGRLSIAGPDLRRLYPVVPLALPASPPYRLEGTLSRVQERFELRELRGVVGDSDIAGSATYVYRRPRPRIEADLKSRVLDLKDLGPLLGVAPAARSGKATGPAGKMLPHEPFSIERLGAIDADVRLQAASIRRPAALPLADLNTHIRVDAGRLELDPLDFGVAGGLLHSRIHLEPRADSLDARAALEVDKLHLASLFPTLDLMKKSTGTLGGTATLEGRGASIAAMLATANGEVRLAMHGGQVSNLLMEYLGLDGGGILKYSLGGDKLTPIRCAVASVTVANGVARTRRLYLDTADIFVGADGSASLRDETLDLSVRPQPKHRSILVLRTPFKVRGTFADPDVSPEAGPLAARAGGALALGLVNPLLALVPLFEDGPGKDSDCKA